MAIPGPCPLDDNGANACRFCKVLTIEGLPGSGCLLNRFDECALSLESALGAARKHTLEIRGLRDDMEIAKDTEDLLQAVESQQRRLSAMHSALMVFSGLLD